MARRKDRNFKIVTVRGTPRLMIKGKRGFRAWKELGYSPFTKEELLERELLRSPKSRYMDEAHTPIDKSKVFSPNSPEVVKWFMHPEKYDVRGIDTAGSNPEKEMEKINPNFLKRYGFVHEVTAREHYPTSKGRKRVKAKKPVRIVREKKVPIKREVLEKKVKGKTIPAEEVKARRRKKVEKPVVKAPVKKPRMTKIEAEIRELNIMAERINKKMHSDIECFEEKGKIVCEDRKRKIKYTPQEIRELAELV